MNAPPSTANLQALIRQKLDVVRVLAELAKQQVAFVESGEMTRLLTLLAGKQTMLTQLQTIEDQLNPYRGQPPQTRQWPSAAERQECLDNVARCEAILAEIIQQEKLAEAVMVRRRDQLATQLQGAQTAGEATAAYVATGYSTAPASTHSGLDLSCEG